MPRYVVLEHAPFPEQGRALHWDFMLESEGALRTWALATEPHEKSSIEALALADHRLAYLDYEGPISGNRGMVVRWDWGTYQPQTWEAGRIVVVLSGSRLEGIATLVVEDKISQRWGVSFSSSAARA